MKSETSMSVQSSKVVQVILTVTKGNDGKELHQYFSFDGLLLAERGIGGGLIVCPHAFSHYFAKELLI